MKTLRVLLCVLLVVCTLAGCSAAPKTFTFQELSITVPGELKDVSSKSEFYQYTFTLDSDEMAVFGNREPAGQLNASGMTLEDYAELIHTANGFSFIPTQRAGHDYLYSYNEATADGTAFKYLIGYFQDGDIFWLIQVAVPVTKYDESVAFGILDSVTFS